MGSDDGTPIIPSEARTSIVKDALGPAAKRYGEKVEPLGDELGDATVKAVRLLITAGTDVVWGFEKVADWLKDAVQFRLRNIPEDKLAESNPRILYPTAQALVYTGPDQGIRELFANLIASDMNVDTKEDVHPAFVEIIKEMTVQEAKVLQYIFDNGPQRRCQYRRVVLHETVPDPSWQEVGDHISINLPDTTYEQLSVSLSNLERLGMLATEDYFPHSENFDEYERHNEDGDQMKEIYRQAALSQMEMAKSRRGIYMTPLGLKFGKVCL